MDEQFWKERCLDQFMHEAAVGYTSAMVGYILGWPKHLLGIFP